MLSRASTAANVRADANTLRWNNLFFHRVPSEEGMSISSLSSSIAPSQWGGGFSVELRSSVDSRN
jgi:hypothetical protein